MDKINFYKKAIDRYFETIEKNSKNNKEFNNFSPNIGAVIMIGAIMLVDDKINLEDMQKVNDYFSVCQQNTKNV